MNSKDIRKLTKEELNKKIITAKEELFTKRMQHSTGSLEKPVELRHLRRDIARMKTILNERKNAGGNDEQ